MLQFLARKITLLLIQRRVIACKETELYQYGFEVFFSTLFCAVAILSYSLLLQDFLSGVIFLVFFMPLRSYAGGYHSPTYGLCFVNTSLCYLAVFALSYITPIGYVNAVSIILVFICDVYIFFCAPANNKYRKLSESKKIKCRLYARVIITIQTFLIILGILFLPSLLHIFYVASLTMALVAILMLLQPRKEVS